MRLLKTYSIYIMLLIAVGYQHYIIVSDRIDCKFKLSRANESNVVFYSPGYNHARNSERYFEFLEENMDEDLDLKFTCIITNHDEYELECTNEINEEYLIIDL